MEWQVQQLNTFDFEKFEKKLAKRVEIEFKDNKRLFGHTLDVVGNVKKIVSREGGKMDILVTTAYLHELGALKYRGDSATVFEGRSFLAEKCIFSSQRSREILSELKFPQEKMEYVSRLLARNDCLELKRAHHNVP